MLFQSNLKTRLIPVSLRFSEIQSPGAIFLIPDRFIKMAVEGSPVVMEERVYFHVHGGATYSISTGSRQVGTMYPSKTTLSCVDLNTKEVTLRSEVPADPNDDTSDIVTLEGSMVTTRKNCHSYLRQEIKSIAQKIGYDIDLFKEIFSGVAVTGNENFKAEGASAKVSNGYRYMEYFLSNLFKSRARVDFRQVWEKKMNRFAVNPFSFVIPGTLGYPCWLYTRRFIPFYMSFTKDKEMSADEFLNRNKEVLQSVVGLEFDIQAFMECMKKQVVTEQMRISRYTSSNPDMEGIFIFALVEKAINKKWKVL